MSNGNPSRKKRPRHKADIEPITLDELLSGAGMSGFLGILDPPVAVPHLQKLVDEIRVTEATVSSQDTVSEHDTVLPTDTVSSQDPHPAALGPATVSSPDTVPCEDTVSSHAVASAGTVASLAAAPAGPAKIRPMKSVQDGHTKAEQLLYTALWAQARPERAGQDGPRILTGGYDQLSALSGLYWSAVKRNLRSLEAKLAIETIASENSNDRVGRTYRIYDPAATLERRRRAGLAFVRRWRGSAELVSDPTVSFEATVSSH